MKMYGDEIHVSTTEASGGVTRHGVRYVLLISLLLAIGLLSAIWITGALGTGDGAENYDKVKGWASETG